jgi:3-hydroxyisobutyrate dehydrogenase
MARIAFVGLGRMGRGMAGRLLGAGHDLVVVNRTPGWDDDLVARGAGRADTPRHAVASDGGVDAVVVMVSDDEASRSVWLGADGVLAGEPAPGTLALDCSTLSHAWLLELAVTAGRHRLRFLDCPVTGLPDAAAAGELTLLVGADAGDLAAARPLLEPMSKAVLHFGPVGTGNAYKLAINLMGAVQIAAAAELLAIAERAGLDLERVADAVATSQAASPQVVRNTRRMVERSHHDDVVFSGRLRRKDTAYGVALAEGLGVEPAFGRVALARLDELLAAGLGEVNESAVIEIARSAPPGR